MAGTRFKFPWGVAHGSGPDNYQITKQSHNAWDVEEDLVTEFLKYYLISLNLSYWKFLEVAGCYVAAAIITILKGRGISPNIYTCSVRTPLPV